MNFVHDLQVRQAKYVAGLSDTQLSRFERGPIRWVFVQAITRLLPRKFSKSVGKDIAGVLEFRLVDPAGGEPDRIQLVMKNGRCRGVRNGALRPDATATVHIADLVRLGASCVDAGWLVADGRVVVTGDPFLFISFPGAFGIRTRPLYSEYRGPNLRP